MAENLIHFFQYQVFFYSTLIVLGSIMLTTLGYIGLKKYKWKYTKKEEQELKNSPFAPGISLVAPAYNEELTIIANINSMLTIDYPLFEIVIINDGSKDKTLELMIEEFDLEETPFAYIERIKTKPFKRIFKSRNPKYDKLTIVDKENGGTKADASNAGINASKYPYFVCTDVDCILSKDILLKMIQPFMDSSTKEQVIAVGAVMRMANSLELNDQGEITRIRPPKGFVPCFQETEYLRSYLISKMGWSAINAVPNVSGGLGMFDKSVVVEAGGYDPISHAEDMDMTLRMIAYMREYDKKYRIVQIPETVCWTEGPPTFSVLNSQRTRWARGLMQIFIVHRKFLFNKRYGRHGLILMPFIFFFEFMAPIIEGTGVIFLIFSLFTKQVNFKTAYVLFFFLYLLGIAVSSLAILFDLKVRKLYKTTREYFKLVLFSLIEAVCYHPFIVFFSWKGYIDFLSRQNFEWGAMKRQGIERRKEEVVE